MSERLSDEQVAMFTDDRWYDPHAQRNKLTATALLAREVQEWRDKDKADDLTHLRLSVDMLNVRDLCIRHGITVEGIVALVDAMHRGEVGPPKRRVSEEFPTKADAWHDGWLCGWDDNLRHFRRVARGEEA